MTAMLLGKRRRNKYVCLHVYLKNPEVCTDLALGDKTETHGGRALGDGFEFSLPLSSSVLLEVLTLYIDYFHVTGEISWLSFRAILAQLC